MAVYRYAALTPKGEEVSGTVEANSEKEAIHRLRDEGVFPTKVRSIGGSPKGNVSGVSQDDKLRQYLDDESQSFNIFKRLRNAIRRKILFGIFRKDRGTRDMR